MNIGNEVNRIYPLTEESAQSVAYALAEYLDVKKNMITQTMRIRNGYKVQCKGDASAEWTKYIGADAAITIELLQVNDTLSVTIGFEKWAEKLGIAAIGAIVFHPLVLTAGIGALRQAALVQDIYNFVGEFLGAEALQSAVETPEEPAPAERNVPETVACPKCGTLNKADSAFCKACGSSLAVQKVYCPQCNTLLDGDETFCPKCGAKLGAADLDEE